MGIEVVQQSSKEELDSSFSPPSSDIMGAMCDHPTELLGTVNAESSLLAQSENVVSEPLETDDVNGDTEHGGSSATVHAKQTDEGKLVAVYGLI